ncbi:hypothetical protein ACS73_20685 [Pseudomonas lini]|nr:hypothetical protein ACS73_20685 [Pseudomonas lini]
MINAIDTVLSSPTTGMEVVMPRIQVKALASASCSSAKAMSTSRSSTSSLIWAIKAEKAAAQTVDVHAAGEQLGQGGNALLSLGGA